MVPEEELLLVKNYLLGAFQRSIDGPFALAERLKTLHITGQNQEYLVRYLDNLKKTNQQDLLTLAQRHFNPTGLTQITVGKKSLSA